MLRPGRFLLGKLRPLSGPNIKSMAKNKSSRKPLAGRVALVAGATRGAGRGIARALGEAGGNAIALRVDHTIEREVKALFQRIACRSAWPDAHVAKTTLQVW